MKRKYVTPLGQRNVRKMIIRIAKEKFWIDTDFTECWPEILLKLPPEIPTKTKYELMYTYLEEDVDEHGRFYQHEVLGLFGAERKNEKEVLLHGCNFIKYTKNGFLLSEDARQLCDAYMADNQWEQRLLEQALKYSLRVRAIMAALMDGGTLVSEPEFLTSMPQVTLKHGNTVYYPFKYKMANTYPNLNTLLMEFKQIALGPFWRTELGVAEHQDFALYSGGFETDPPSIDQIGPNLKPSFVLMYQLGWFTEKRGGMFVLNKRKIKKEIDTTVYKSLMNGKKTTAKPVEPEETVEIPAKPVKADATKAAKSTAKTMTTTTKAKATKAATSTKKTTKATRSAKSVVRTKKAATSAKRATTPAKAAKATKPTKSTKPAKPAAKAKVTKPATPTTPALPAKEVEPIPAAKPTKATKTAKTKRTTTSAKKTTKAKASKAAKPKTPKAAKPVARTKEAAASAKMTKETKATKATKPTKSTKSAKPAAKAKTTKPAKSTKPAARETRTSRTAKSVTRGKKAA